MNALQRFGLNGKNLLEFFKNMLVGSPRNVSMNWYNADDSVTTYTYPNFPKIFANLANVAKMLLFKKIYIDEINGDDNNSGLSANSPIKTWAKAYSLFAPSGGRYNIYLMSDLTIKSSEHKYIYLSKIYITSSDGVRRKLKLIIDSEGAPCVYFRSSATLVVSDTIDYEVSNTTNTTYAAMSIEENSYCQLGAGDKNIGDNCILVTAYSSRLRVSFGSSAYEGTHTIANTGKLINVGFEATLGLDYSNGTINGKQVTTNILKQYISGIRRDADTGMPYNITANVNLK